MEGLWSRFIETLLSPFWRTRIDPTTDALRRTVNILLEQESALTTITENVESGRTRTDTAASDIDSLRGDSRRIMEHLAALQEGYDGVRNDNAHIGEHLTALQTDHDKVREHFAALQEDQTALRGTVAELVAALKRIDSLWADLHRDMTALADALSRREEG